MLAVVETGCALLCWLDIGGQNILICETLFMYLTSYLVNRILI